MFISPTCYQAAGWIIGQGRLIACTDNDEEAQPLLITNDADNNSSYKTYHPAITMGVSMHLGKWPAHLFSIFMTVCIVSAGFIALTFVTIIFFRVPRRPRWCYKISLTLFLNRYSFILTVQDFLLQVITRHRNWGISKCLLYQA